MELKEIEAFARKNNIPVLLGDSAEFLANIISNKKPNNILEIGTAIGYSGTIILLSSENANLTTIEKNEESYNHATQTFKTFGVNKRVTQLLGDGFGPFPFTSSRYITPLNIIFTPGCLAYSCRNSWFLNL